MKGLEAKEVWMDEASNVVPVHMSGPIRPFAVCRSFTAAEPHTRDTSQVTCPACLEHMKAARSQA